MHGNSLSSTGRFRGLLRWPLLLLAAAPLLLTVPGCGGCNRDDQAKNEKEKKKEEEKKKKKKKKKPDFEIGRVRLQPGGRNESDILRWLKPGHWVTASQQMKTNHFDFVGSLDANVIDRQQRPIGLVRTPFRLATTRPAVLPKGQAKQIEMVFFVPHASGSTQLATTLRGRRGSGEVYRGSEIFSSMQPHQYYFVVLADMAERLAYVKTCDAVRVPWESQSNTDLIHYYVVAPRLTRPLALPTHPLTWTSIAYVLWDDVDPQYFSPEQQQAMIDWLHWGGQLLVSGPDSLDALRGSFLDPYLPADGGEARTLDGAAIEPLSTRWTIPPRKGPPVPLSARRPWSGITLARRPEGVEVPGTGGLVMERPVGRGRIALTAFRLDQRELLAWPSFQSFFNAGLLRRPHRRYASGEFGGAQLLWAAKESRGAPLAHSDRTGAPNDSRFTTNLRYLTRDAGRDTEVLEKNVETVDPLGAMTLRREVADPIMAGGMASWNPLSDTSNAARDTLRDAAGIEVPKSSFVVRMLVVYLLVLVPLNWLLFTALGRVELAWVAAPLIAIVCSLLVVRMAHLNIGFARAQTEVAVLELQGSYPRGHLTRYTALYAALSTSYDATFPDGDAVAQPFPVDPDFKMLLGQRPTTVTFRRLDEVQLTGMPVSSNSTGMLQSEQMVELGGPIELGTASSGQPQVNNGTQYDLADAALIGNPADGSLRVAWLGNIPAGGGALVKYAAYRPGDVAGAHARAGDDGPPFDIRRLLKIVEAVPLRQDDLRLVARIDERLPGADIRPDSSQRRATTLVVAHLAYGAEAPPRRDYNLRTDLRPENAEANENASALTIPSSLSIAP